MSERDFCDVAAEQRFWSKVRKSDGCWEWTAGTGGRGYGCFHMMVGGEKTKFRAHRVSWEIHYGPIPDGLYVLHRCDNRPCVRPDHLFLGTHLDNMRDASAKGRLHTPGRSTWTHCQNGHKYTSENTDLEPWGHRRCRKCHEADAEKTNARTRRQRQTHRHLWFPPRGERATCVRCGLRKEPISTRVKTWTLPNGACVSQASVPVPCEEVSRHE